MFTPAIRTMLVATPLILAAGSASAGSNLVVNGNFESLTGASNGEVVVNPNGTQATTGTYVTSANSWYANFNSAQTEQGSTQAYPFIFFTNDADGTGFGDASPNDNGQRYLWGSANGGSAMNGSTTVWDGTSPTSLGGGGNFAVLDGDYNVAALNQNISGLIKGASYQLSFIWAGAQWSLNSGATSEAIQISLGDQTRSTSTVNIASHGFSGWQTYTTTFVWDGVGSTLSFLAQGGPAGYPPVSLLDNVVLSQVPEPGSAAMLGAGFLAIAGLGARHLRRRAAPKAA